ncbi:PEGA domain-containing protein, partial [Candidatus Woesebacteria bacterium]|nr:PEGA domain-containing protein [Candidatus Woesebacteria bacterium]
MPVSLNRRVIYTLLSALFILGGTLLAIQYAKGKYRLSDDGFIPGAGLLSVTSIPASAEVFVNGNLTTATNDTIYLEPNEYDIKIVKDGYTTWEKKLRVEQELVTQTNAKLFPLAPSLSTLTFTGVQNVVPSPDGQKIAYYTASASAERKNGLYVLELSDSPFSLQKGPRQLAADSDRIDLATAQLIWSPDSTELLLIGRNRELILQAGQLNDLNTLPDIRSTRNELLSDWEEEMFLREQEFLTQFPAEIISIATQSAKNVYISPDKKRLLYTATEPATIPDALVPPLPATNTQPEERQVQPSGIYVYDREEDKNFRIGTETPAVLDAY